MARLARYASTPPDQFGRLTPAQTRELDAAVELLLRQETNAQLELVFQHARLTMRRGF
jgi:hypothetical protein